LSESTRAFFEPRFGHDFSQVRTHKNSHSSQMNRTLNAKAFTDKKDIYYGTGNYPGNNALTAHELTHVVQQTNGNPLSSKLNRQPKIKAINSRNTVQRANSFESFGSGVKRRFAFRGMQITFPRKITRFEQVPSGYGMECAGTSIMYIIQSYGLVPPNMTREEFEYAFTPLNPYNPSSPLPKTPDIKVGGQQQRGVKAVDLFTKALTGRDKPSTYRCGRYGKLTKAEMTLRGIKGGYFGSTVMRKMPSILAAFEEQSREPGYDFMKAYRPVSGGAYPRKTPKTRERWFNCYTQLKAGTILANYANYFQEGNTILAGVNTKFPPRTSLKHWVVIVKDKEHTITLGGKSYHLYPADDPLGYQIYVMVPWPFTTVLRKLFLRKLFLIIYENKKPKAYTHNGKIVRRLSIKRSNSKGRVYKRRK
ncbi:DUF4157 domain-containing protein, partial [bacterium]|nr:DUF4157 domain-containing protein [bacterium]